FARYSVDDRWLVPHFEKMLYDNALLARVYLRAWQVTGAPSMLKTARETLDYLGRDMADSTGGLHSAEDADAGGREGAFAVWTWAELADVLGSDRDLAAAIYGATPEGNFDGANILHLPEPLHDVSARLGTDAEALGAAKHRIDERLRERRSDRERPGRDDKIVTAWNGLALRAFAEAAAILGDEGYLATAHGIAEFLTGPAWNDGRIRRSWRRGTPGPNGFCDDYAATALGLFALYQATGEERWYQLAEEATRTMIRLFADDTGGFYATASDGERLITRPKNVHDNPTPSDNALAAEALAVLAAYTGDADLSRMVEDAVRSIGTSLSMNPGAHGHALGVWLANPIREVAVVGRSAERRPFIKAVWEGFRPDVVVAEGDGEAADVPLLVGRTPGEGARAYVCRGFVCDLPAESPTALRSQLGSS
ncbi:MAG: thioredoxin domain-containing protein, partial [Actinomycetota bacterium]